MKPPENGYITFGRDIQRWPKVNVYVCTKKENLFGFLISIVVIGDIDRSKTSR